MWNRAASPSVYSSLAVKRTLAARGTSLTSMFTKFGTWNRNPATFYSEGTAYHAAPVSKKFTLRKAHRATGLWQTRLDHLSHGFVRFKPGTTLKGTWRLRVTVDLPNTSHASAASVVVHRRNGSLAYSRISLSAKGKGSRTVGFARSKVAFVELDLVNASIRSTCNLDTRLSCAGVPLDDGRLQKFSAKAIR